MDFPKLSAPIYDALVKYSESSHSSFHTPGHKSITGASDFFKIYPYDATELSCTDELYSPEGCIYDAEIAATELFGSYHTFLSAGGASQCVKAALAEFAGKKVLFDRNIHFSASSGIAFYGIDAIFVCGKTDSKTNLPSPPTVDDFRMAFYANPDCSAVFLTSPNYFGVSADCLAIRTFCDEVGITFIDDNSHGTHYAFCSEMKNSPFDGHHAHVVIDSAHKTLPVMTGGSFLHYNKKISLSTVRRRMMAAGSTSPSFPILASLDYGRAICAEYGTKVYSDMCASVLWLKNDLISHGFFLAKGENVDPLRLSVYFGDQCEKILSLLESEHIYPEMTANGFLVFIITPFNESFQIHRLKEVLLTCEPVEYVEKFLEIFEMPKHKLSIRAAFFAEKELVLPLDSANRISAEMIAFHEPPCVPLVLPGEIISHKLSRMLHERNYGNVEVLSEKNDLFINK